MKKRKLTASFFMAVAILVAIPSFASVEVSTLPARSTVVDNNWSETFKTTPEVKALTPEMMKMSIDAFLKLTPAKYKEMTGKKLGLKKSLELKAAQKMLKNKMSKGADLSKGVYILLVLLGWGFLAMGLLDDWSGNDWWINLLLTFLCWLPGVIHGLVKMKKYYN